MTPKQWLIEKTKREGWDAPVWNGNTSVMVNQKTYNLSDFEANKVCQTEAVNLILQPWKIFHQFAFTLATEARILPAKYGAISTTSIAIKQVKLVKSIFPKIKFFWSVVNIELISF